MATFALNDLKLWVDAADLSGDHNSAQFTYDADLLDSTTFGATYRTFVKGLQSMSVSLAGYVSTGTGEIEELMAADLGGTRITSWSPDGGDAGETAYLSRDLLAQVQPVQGSVGDLAAFSASAQGSGRFARGLVLEPGAAGKTATFDGTAYQTGATATGETLCGALHVLTVSGTNPTLDVVVQSDALEGMGSPTTALTFTQATAAGSEWQSASGPLTDDWHRVSATIGGTDTPTFLFVVTVGIATN